MQTSNNTKNSSILLIAEMVLLFVMVPVSFVLNYSVWFKIIVGILGFTYIIYVLLKVERIRFKMSQQLKWRKFFKRVIIQLILIAIITGSYVWLVDRPNFLWVVINKPYLWLLMLFVYSVFSVYPQEVIYRTFFFKRYQSLFVNQNFLLLINAVLFSMAHLFFKNTLVLIMTFVGGILFAFTFLKTKSTLLVTIEHALYGCCLFTVGMGDMLGFPN